MDIELGVKAQVAARRSGKGRALSGHTFDDAVPILGDSPHHRVAWRGGDRIQLEERRSFMLRFRLRCAKLFAFEVEK